MDDQKIITIGGTLIVILVIIFIFFFMIKVMENSMQRTNNFCDEKYGVENWHFKDITGTKEANNLAGRFYLGQVWECYEK